MEEIPKDPLPVRLERFEVAVGVSRPPRAGHHMGIAPTEKIYDRWIPGEPETRQGVLGDQWRSLQVS
ncbi:MAG: hypothetical protein AAF357_05860 [Verrucomicrobiota bacterium]